ncbi:beta strand repeat-containing protein, partial [Roseivirga seohaensis]|uniref:beta strand repeat-containing protein n=1 Tax=Roseivirga seohaensis TaxID=1914963 RepID=UPI000B15271E
MNLVHIKYKAFSEVFNKRFFLALPFFFFLFLNGSKAQTTGSVITFEAGSARLLTGASTNPSATNIDGHALGVSAVTSGNIVNITVNNTVTGISGGSDLAVIMTATGTNVTSFSYKSDNAANNFGVTSFAFAVATGTTQNITVQGYDNGSAVSGAITKTISSPGVTNFTVTSGDVSASSGWGNIDEIRMTMNTPAPANFAIDDVLLAAAVASNNAPTASSFTANPSENLTYTFSASDFGYSDGDGDPLSSVLIEALPTNGTLYLDADNDDVFDGGEAVSVSQQISVANINAGNLQYIQNGSSNTSFQFEVNDGTENSSGNYIATLTMRAVPTVTLSITPTSKSESITTASIVTATLSNAYGANTTVNLSFSGSATGSGVDYTISSSSITVGAGNTTNSIVLTNVPDVLYEGNETVIIDISSVSNGTENGTQQRTFTIIDDDSQPNATLEVLPIYNPITDESGGQAYIRGKIDAVAGTTVTIPLSFSGTATGGGTDYSLTGTTITLSPGEIMDSVRVTSQFDGIEEGSETIIVDMGAPTNAVESGTQQVTITINDEDATYPSTTITTGAGNPTNSSPFSVTITFSESVTGFAVGDITVSNGSAGNFAGSGTTYTADITPTGDGAVTVDVGAGAAQDAFGNNNTAATQLSRTYDATAPATPSAPNLTANWDTGTSNSDDITSNTQPRFSGSTEANASIKIISSIDGQVGTSTANGSGNWLQTISGTLSEGTHNITFTATDAAGNESAASAALSIVVDTSNPTLSSSSPADDATGVNTSGNITLTFNENIAFGTGNIEVIDETNGSNSFTIDAASPGTQASISGAVLTINPSSNLDLSSNYSVRIAATAIDDIAGNSYAGITNGTALNFGTNNAPTVTVNTGLTLNEGATELIDSGKLNASDTEGGTLTFTITTATTKGTLFIDTNPSNTFNAGDTELVLNATFTKNDLDSDRIRYVSTTDNDISDSFVFKVSDPDGGELTNQTFNITITPVNDAPTATGVPTDITVIEDAASNFDLSAVTLVDPDGDALTATLAASAGTFTATSGGGVTIGGSGTASLTLAGTAANINTYFDTPANIKYTGASNVSGDNAATFTLNANDATVNPQVGSGNIDITAVNDAPTFTIGANQTVAQNAGAQSINSFITTFDDGDAEATQTVQFNITNNTNATLFTSGPAISATGVLTFTPDATKFGKATISVTISDNGGTANSGVDTSPAQTFDIFVTPTNIKINEVHAGAGPDAEFIEVYNTEANATSLSGLVMVWFNGGDDLAYKDFDLTGSTNANGFYVIGETAFGSKDQDWGASPDLQNGPDAVALYVGSQNDFTGASAPTLDGLVDVIVYGSSDDATLRAALGNPALQVAGDASNSISRSADGTGGFVAQTPSPQVTNDVTSPTVTSVSVPANATYIASQNLDFTVNFSENVTVVTTGGIPQLAITVGSTTRQAVYQSGSGTSGLLFRYVVQSGEAGTDGISVGTLAANGGTLKDAATNDANLTLNSVGATTAVLVDAVAPTVTSVSVPANATYIAGQNLDFTVNFSENVTVVTTGGIPQLAVTIGSTTRQAVYQSGSGTSGLLFRYVVQSGEADTDGISVGTLASNGGTLKDAVTNDANLTLNSVGATTAVLVDAVAPTVTSVSVPANATYVAGQNLDFTVNFSENVTVVDAGGTPQLAITIGSTTRQAAYTSGTGTGALLFRYVVQSGDVDTDGISVGTLAANGGTLKDAATNDANLTLNSVGTTTAVLVDAVAPVITSLSLHNGNTFVEIFASEGLYSTNGGSGALEIADIAISISGGTATSPVITSLKKVDGTTDL